jgi:multiple sugar transport system substrate-binding protein
MSSRPRRRAALAALAVTAVTLAGCSGGAQPASTAAADPNAPVHLTWWTGQTADAEALLEGLAKEFTAAHPNVTIDVSSGAPTTDDLLQKMTAGFASDTYPDVSYAFGSWASQLGESGKTLDLTEDVKDPAVNWADFPQVARDTASPKGVTIGFPAIVDNLALIYNPDLFAAAGVPEPGPDFSWDDFRAAAKAITEPAQNIYGTAYSVSASEDTTWHFWPLLWQNGGDVLSPDETKTAFNSPAGVKSLEFLRAMAVDDKSVYLDQTDEKYAPLFEDGRVGMIISGPWVLYDLTQKGTSYKVAPLPGTAGNHQTVSGPDIWALFDHGDANRAHWALEFTKWLTSAPIDARWNLTQGNLPLRASEASSPEYAEYIKNYPGADVMFANLKNATKPRPTVPAYPEVSQFVGTAISQVMQGAAQPSDALADAARQGDQALSGS